IMKYITDPLVNILFYCDGFDEHNQSSLQLFREIRDLKEKFPFIKLIVTTRPERVKEFYHNKGEVLNINHIKICGIHESKRCEFLKNYHSKITNESTEPKTSELLKFYNSFSAKIKELYRLPLNLVMLAWLWEHDNQQAQTVKSAAGLYTAILDILYQQLVSRIVQSKYRIMEEIEGDLDELKYRIELFKEKLYEESLLALRNDKISIDKAGVKRLRLFCKDNKLPFNELKAACVLSDSDLVTSSEESIQFPHKGFIDYYAAKYLESKLCSPTTSIKIIKVILLEFYGEDYKDFYISKYQNVFQLLGGILALKDMKLVGKYGEEIIKVLIETGVRNNTQWFTVYSELTLNPQASEKFAKLIEPHLNLRDLTIKDSQVEILSTLLAYLNVKSVKLDISDTAILDQFPNLIEILRQKQSDIAILTLTDKHVEYWNSSITNLNVKSITLDISDTAILDQFPDLIDILRQKQSEITIPTLTDKHVAYWNAHIKETDVIRIDKVVIKQEQVNLSFLSHIKSIEYCKVQRLWRGEDLHTTVPDIPRWPPMKGLWTAVSIIQELPTPTTLVELGLCLMVDPTTGAALPPTGLHDVQRHCPNLEYLQVHVRGTCKTGHLHSLPDVKDSDGEPSVSLWLSHIQSVDWAIEVATALLPRCGQYGWLYLPGCRLSTSSLCRLIGDLSAAGVRVRYRVRVASSHTADEETQLKAAVVQAYPDLPTWGGLRWYQDDEEMSRRPSGGW
ncbi:unnamed protein product, partial [Meganyctiphanes norvegica]